MIQPCSRVCAIAALVLLSACSAAAGPISYLVTVDTSSVNGNSGFLDFQFNSDPTSQAASAAISSFNAVGGTLGAGPLPGPLTFTIPGNNDNFQPFTYGTSFSFVLSLSGPALSSPDGTGLGIIFGLGLYDGTLTAILTDQGSGFAGTVEVNSDGTTTATGFPIGSSVVSFQPIGATTTPEPGTTLLMGFGTAGLLMLRKILR